MLILFGHKENLLFQWLCVELLLLKVEPICDEEDGGGGVEAEGFVGGQQQLRLQPQLVLLRPPVAVVGQAVDIT